MKNKISLFFFHWSLLLLPFDLQLSFLILLKTFKFTSDRKYFNSSGFVLFFIEWCKKKKHGWDRFAFGTIDVVSHLVTFFVFCFFFQTSTSLTFSFCLIQEGELMATKEFQQKIIEIKSQPVQEIEVFV